jgi:hypothetical protein
MKSISNEMAENNIAKGEAKSYRNESQSAAKIIGVIYRMSAKMKARK